MRNKCSTAWLLAGISAIGLASMATGATAQDATPQIASGGLEEIVVTATRRSESLQEVPITISALTAESLNEAQVENLVDLRTQTASLTTNYTGASVAPFLRGVGAIDSSPGQENSVALYVDGVYQADATYTFQNDFNNISRVEVLKGPQGTLFGRNATGGAIQIITKDPSHTQGMQGSVSLGNYSTIESKLYATGGLGENLAADIAFSHHSQNKGFGRNIDTGREINKYTNTAVRSKWLFTPGEGTTIVITGDFADWTSSLDNRQPYPGTTIKGRGVGYTGDYYNAYGGLTSSLEGHGWGVTGRFEQELSPFNVISISAYRRAKVRNFIDPDLSPASIVDVDYTGGVKAFTQELQLQSKSSSKLKWTVGGFYMSSKDGFEGPRGLALIGSTFGGPTDGVSIINVIHTKSYSVFGEATYPVLQNTNLTLGARYTKDKRKLVGYTDVITNAIIPQDDYETVLTIPGDEPRFSYSKPTWRAILDHHFSDDVMAYASVSRGFKSGNFNTSSGTTFDSETITAYEVGSKADLLGGRLRLNPAVYLYQYDDIQVFTVPEPSVVLTTNAGKAKLYGIELAGQLLATDNLSIAFSGALSHNEYTSYENAQCYTFSPAGGNTTSVCDLSNTPLPKAPKFTASISPTYSIAMGNGTFVLSASYYHSDRYLGCAGCQDAFAFYPTEDIVNARAAWSTRDDHFGVALWVKNITSDKTVGFGYASTDYSTYTAGPPRTYGFEVNFKF